ncbi:Hypothetical protein NTJ_01010 [Nesidiocoris tenuis]|uniref:Uncharacterized protein n=1 Tax=Nesidiocoris tenuis TaxID=355587 RepID=A0ABN7AA94_9HEMI|nr:Hypothetical protein NTJ_01010 [Nesidiocoris tenuis]
MTPELKMEELGEQTRQGLIILLEQREDVHFNYWGLRKFPATAMVAHSLQPLSFSSLIKMALNAGPLEGQDCALSGVGLALASSAFAETTNDGNFPTTTFKTETGERASN